MFASLFTSLPVTWRRVGLGALAASTVALTACGGGGDRAADYKPDSIVSFGDESSAFASFTLTAKNNDGTDTGSEQSIKGLTYVINALPDLADTVTYCTYSTPGALCADGTTQTGVTNFVATDTDTVFAYFTSVNQGGIFNTVTKIELGTRSYASTSEALKRTTNQFYNCAVTTNWAQYVARSFGKGFEAECQLDLPGAFSYASAGDKVADLATKVALAKADGRLKAGVLVTVWVGQNDILEIFEDGAVTNKVAAVEQRAASLIASVKQILDTGAKVVLVNAPNLAYSPRAVALKQTGCKETTKDCNGDMEVLVTAFNKQLLTSLGSYASRGRELGYVDAERLSNLYARDTRYENKRQCDTSKMMRPDGAKDDSSLAYCNTNTLVADDNVGIYLWADDVRLSRTLHTVIGQTAFTRAVEQF